MSEKIHSDQAARQKAYRDRLKARRAEAGKGWTDEELAQAVRDLHLRLQALAAQGDDQAAQLLGSNPLETLERIGRTL